MDKDEQGKGLVWAAWLLSLGAVATLYFGLVKTVLGTPPEELTVFYLAGGLGCILAMGISFWAILRVSGAAGEHALFDTWFPMFMSLVPIAGPFIALWSAIKLLLRNKLTQATITTSSGGSRSTSHHPETLLHGSGRPAGLLLLALMGLQPMVYLMIDMEDEPSPALEQIKQAIEEHEANKGTDEPKSRIANWEKQACSDLIECYQAADHVGQVAGQVTMTIDAQGRVIQVDLRLPQATQAVSDCVRRAAKNKHLADYNGLPASLRCNFAGTLSGPVGQVHREGRYSPKAERL